jgi:hypothetical protein
MMLDSLEFSIIMFNFNFIILLKLSLVLRLWCTIVNTTYIYVHIVYLRMVYNVIRSKTLLISCHLKILRCIIWYFYAGNYNFNSDPHEPICVHTNCMYLLEYINNNIIQ